MVSFITNHLPAAEEMLTVAFENPYFADRARITPYFGIVFSGVSLWQNVVDFSYE